MNECKAGDYLYCEGEEEIVFLCSKDWKPDPSRKFNRLTVIQTETGDTFQYSDSDIGNLRFRIFPESKKKELEKRRTESLANKIEGDEDILEKVKESLQTIYPNNWDLDISTLNSRAPYTLVIKFPEITITNGRRESHVIKDLYVRWKFGIGFRIKKSLEGIRGTLSYLEYKSGYSHSHLPSRNAQDWNAFCLGSGGFADLNQEWCVEDKKFIQEEFELLLYQLGAYVKWESLGGGPYIRISGISVRGNSMHVRDEDIKRSLKRIINSISCFPLKYNSLSNRFDVNFLDLEKEISEVTNKNNIPVMRVKKTGAGDYLYGDITEETIRDWISTGNDNLSGCSISFKGEDIPIRILEFKKSKNSTYTRTVVHPNIIERLRQKLITRTNNYFIKTYGK